MPQRRTHIECFLPPRHEDPEGSRKILFQAYQFETDDDFTSASLARKFLPCACENIPCEADKLGGSYSHNLHLFDHNTLAPVTSGAEVSSVRL